MTTEACTREHLRALVEITYIYDVSAGGELGDGFEEWQDPRQASTDYIEEYRCDNCCEYFTPEKRSDEESRAKAWQAALNHLKGDGVAA